MPDGTGLDALKEVRSLDGASGAIPAPLLLWFSPAFPVGGFAFSHGLEWAAERGWIKDRETLAAWLEDLVAYGALGNDQILLCAVWHATMQRDGAALREAIDLAVALQPSAERHLETVTQGGAFMTQIEASWPCAAISWVRGIRDGEIAYCTAVGIAAAGHGIALQAFLVPYGLAVVGNLVSAAVRLGVVGQTDGQRVLAGLVPEIESVSRRSLAATLADLGGACWHSDLASLQHETQYTRLFRS
ncbi:MAG: urease accessory protein UreF [Hyphomicrobiaceae bacterium]